ncbi:MAG: universal stress protein [Desulfobacterales bacterium]|nr:universal stress protein [Desulfobacterales bacterium]
MAAQKILLPYNFTNLDQKAIAFVSRTFVHLGEVEITLFNAYTPVPEIEAPDTSVMGKLKGNLSYLSQKIMQREAELGEVKEKLVQSGFAQSAVCTVFKPRKKDVATEIIEHAIKDKFDIVVINHKSGRASRFFTGSVFNKVVSALKDITVCIVS